MEIFFDDRTRISCHALPDISLTVEALIALTLRVGTPWMYIYITACTNARKETRLHPEFYERNNSERL